MSIEKELQIRSGSKCELCATTGGLKIYIVPLSSNEILDDSLYLCDTCIEQIEEPDKVDVNHWRCLNDCMWSEIPIVQVMAWRMLNRLRSEGWPQDLLDMLYLDEDTMARAKATGEGEDNEDKVRHIDSNGSVLEAGDTVVLIKTLDVKGSNFSAKRGTAVRKISLVADNPEHIEGRVNGQQIVILTKYVKKSV